MKKKTAVIFGITGQDGSYLAEYLLSLDYYVIGVNRRSSTDTTGRIKHLVSNNDFTLIEGDLTDPSSVGTIICRHRPHECYNLAAQSHVKTSFEQPTTTFNINAVGVLNILDAIKNFSSYTKFYQASTSEMFGSNMDKLEDGTCVQTIDTILHSRSPYAVAKVAAHHLVQNYRESYGLHACCGILFNHESPRRGEEFVTRKITKWIGKFVKWKEAHRTTEDWLITADDNEIYVGGRTSRDQGLQFPKLRLGNIKAYRDWGHAKDYVRAMHMMLQVENPTEYVVSTGITHSVEDFLKLAFEQIGIFDWENYIVIDPEFYRPSEVEYLLGDSTPIQETLGWAPQYAFEDLVYEMVQADVENARSQLV